MGREVVVLTGAAGFIGHHTLRLLISSDPSVREIRCLDRVEPTSHMVKLINEELDKLKNQKSGGRKSSEQQQSKIETTTKKHTNCLENESESRRSSVAENEDGNVEQEDGSGERNKKIVTWIKGDIRDINVVEQTLAGAHCVIHCAAKVDFWIYTDDQDREELESINVGGTETLLKASIRLGVPKFIHVSSFEVYSSWDTLYYCTETTLPEMKWFLFGPSAETKHQAEELVKRYSSTKLLVAPNQPHKQSRSNQEAANGSDKNNLDSLNAIIIRLPPTYGEFDKHYVTKILEATKFFGGKLQRLSNVWIRQQPIYVQNAAWSLIKAKQRMDIDQSISGEEFHVTDETTIGDPFDFLEPYLECKNMHVTKNSYASLPIWILLLLLFSIKKYLASLDVFNLFTSKKGRLQQAMEEDELKRREKTDNPSALVMNKEKTKPKVWYDYVTPSTISFMSNSHFLNRTKASLRLDYDPLVDPNEARYKSLDWYKNHLEL